MGRSCWAVHVSTPLLTGFRFVLWSEAVCFNRFLQATCTLKGWSTLIELLMNKGEGWELQEHIIAFQGVQVQDKMGLRAQN